MQMAWWLHYYQPESAAGLLLEAEMLLSAVQ